jgi:hypothetical protein
MEPEKEVDKVEDAALQAAPPAAAKFELHKEHTWLIAGALLAVVASVAASVLASTHAARELEGRFGRLSESVHQHVHQGECEPGADTNGGDRDRLAGLGVKSEVFSGEWLHLSSTRVDPDDRG